MKAPRFSICIPVRNGGEYLRSTLKLCLEQKSFDDYEVVVSDNQSDEDIAGLVASFKNGKLKYVKTPKYLGMGANFDFALDAAAGEYKMIIGSDDGISTYALYILDKIIRITGERLVMWNRSEYYWPNHHWLKNKIGSYSRLGQNLIRGEDMARRCVRYINGDPPHIYDSAVIHKDLIQETESKTGRRLHDSFLADYYEGITSALVAGRYIKLRYPLSLYAERTGSASAKIENNLTDEYLKKHHSRDEIEKMNAKSVVPTSVFSRQFYFYLQKYIILCQVVQQFGEILHMDQSDISVKKVINFTLTDYAYRASLMGNGEEFRMAVDMLWEDVAASGDEDLKEWFFSRFMDQRNDERYIARCRDYFETDEKRRFGFVLDCDSLGIENVYEAQILWDNIHFSKDLVDQYLEDYQASWKRAEFVSREIRDVVKSNGKLGIYGAGLSGVRMIRLIRYFIEDLDFEIELFDKGVKKDDSRLLSSEWEYKVFSPDRIANGDCDAIVIGLYRYDEEVLRSIQRMDPQAKIIRIFEPFEHNWLSALTDG